MLTGKSSLLSPQHIYGSSPNPRTLELSNSRTRVKNYYSLIDKLNTVAIFSSLLPHISTDALDHHHHHHHHLLKGLLTRRRVHNDSILGRVLSSSHYKCPYNLLNRLSLPLCLHHTHLQLLQQPYQQQHHQPQPPPQHINEQQSK